MGMSDPVPSDTVQKDPMVSTPTLALPHLDGAEKEFQDHVYGPNHDAERKSLEEEDKEWLENPAHPRNWLPRKKWGTMAIVSLPRPETLSLRP